MADQLAQSLGMVGAQCYKDFFEAWSGLWCRRHEISCM